MIPAGVGSPDCVRAFAPKRAIEPTTIQVPQGKIDGLAGTYEFPHVRVSGLQKAITAPTSRAPEKTSLVERVSSTAGAMVPVAASPIREMECMLTELTRAGEIELAERAQADQATSKLMDALAKRIQALVKENKALNKRVIFLESAQRGSDIVHRSVLQASESRFQTKIQALQAKIEDLEVRLDFALKEPPHLRSARWIEEMKRNPYVAQKL